MNMTVITNFIEKAKDEDINSFIVQRIVKDSAEIDVSALLLC